MINNTTEGGTTGATVGSSSRGLGSSAMVSRAAADAASAVAAGGSRDVSGASASPAGPPAWVAQEGGRVVHKQVDSGAIYFIPAAAGQS